MKLALAADDDSALSSGTSTVCLLLEAENVPAISQTKTVPSIKGGGGGAHAQPSNLSDHSATFLASGVSFQASRPAPCFQHSSIKVYLSAIRSPH